MINAIQMSREKEVVRQNDVSEWSRLELKRLNYSNEVSRRTLTPYMTLLQAECIKNSSYETEHCRVI